MDEDLRKFNRLLRLLHYLSNPGGVSVKRAADQTGVDVRTVYRDLDELRDACFDIIQVRPKGPYRLNGEYTSLGQTLTLEEVLCLGLAGCVLHNQLGGVGREAIRKLQHFIKGEKKQKARDFPDSIEIQPGEEHQWIPQLVTAVSQQRRIQFEYTRGEPPTRTVDPYTLFYQDQRWYIQGFDPLRGELRRFSLARMLAVETLAHTFVVPKAYESKSALFHKWDICQNEPLEVECLVDASLAQWLREKPVHPTQVVDGDRFTLRVRDLDALAQWLLSLRGVRVLQPASLRSLVRDKALAMAHAHE